MQYCDQCTSEKEKHKFYNKNICLDCINNQEGEKLCSICNTSKKLTEFYRKQLAKFGRKSSCKTCDLEIKRKLYKNKHPTEYTPIDINLYKEFIHDNIDKTDNVKDKISITLLYKLYKIYIINKNLHYTMPIPYFLEQLEQTQLLGKYEKAGFHSFKLKI